MLRTLPMVKDRQAYRGMVVALAYSDDCDKYGNVFISREFLATLEGKENECSRNHYKGVNFLNPFQRDIAPGIVIIDHGFDCETNRYQPRRVRTSGLPPELIAIAEEDQQCRDWSNIDQVFALDGKPVSSVALWRRRKIEREAALQSKPLCAIQDKLLIYMNTLPSNQFTALVKYDYKAYDAIEVIAEAKRKQIAVLEEPRDRAREEQRLEGFLRVQRRTIHNFRVQPQPFYGVSERRKTTRLVNHATGLLTMKREARKAITGAAGWIECDLANAQLAVVATDWGIGEITDFLRSRRSIWPELCSWLGLPLIPEVKKVIKTFLYSLTYGMQESAAKGQVTQGLASLGFTSSTKESFGKRLCQHPLLQQLVARREAMVCQIMAEGQIYDCFNRQLSIDWSDKDVTPRRQAFQLLSVCAQARELDLLKYVIEAACAQDKRAPAWRIMLFQHDGFTISVTDRRKQRIEKVLAELEQLVAIRASELGIPTWLENDYKEQL